MLGVCMLFFGATSAVDPGVITKENEQHHQARYPYDDVTNTQKDCDTCHVSKPARSKHCRICNGCVLNPMLNLTVCVHNCSIARSAM